MSRYLAFDISNTTINPAAKVADIGTILNFVLPFITIIGGLLFLGMLMVGAITWLTAGDKPDHVEKAWKIITFAVLGLFVVLLSFVGVKVIGLVLGTGNPLPY